MRNLVDVNDGVSYEILRMFMNDVGDKGLIASNARHKTGGKRYNEVGSDRKRGRPKKCDYGIDPRLPAKVITTYI